jgi:glycosyltransferase involved in cell wall biosynthesis
MEYFDVSGMVRSSMNALKKSKKVLHVITGLNNGGAEAVLFRLCVNDLENEHLVVSLMDFGKYGPLLLDKGIDVFCLNMPQGNVTITGLLQLYRLFKELKPDVVQTWMYHADLIGGVVARSAGIKNVFWNIRHSNLEKGLSNKNTIYVAKACAYLSHVIPKAIICCASNAVSVHTELGYSKKKMNVIGNGYELDRLSINQKQGDAVKKEFSLSDTSYILGMVGRYDPQKDHLNLLKSLNLLDNKGLDFKCLLVGRELNNKNTELMQHIKNLNLTGSIILLDQRSDIPAIMNALDIHILSSSFGEAFPNVLAESMACGTPCVTTDVGDAALIVGDTGWVVPPSSTECLTQALQEACEEKENTVLWKIRQQEARMRIVDNFSLKNMIKKYHRVWG